MIIIAKMVMKKTTARMTVILSKFFSIMVVPLKVPEKLLASMSLIPVPFPEWSMTMMTSPMPDIAQTASVIINRTLN